MPITDQFRRVPLSLIVVRRDDRQRREIDTKGLIGSIKRRGVLQPIIVDELTDGTLELIAGERRLSCCRELGLPDIPIRLASSLSPIEREILELEENVKRSDLTWRETVKAVARIHELFEAKAALAGDSWTQSETAEEISIEQPTISLYLKVYSSFDDPNVERAGTVREAYNLLLRRDARAAGNALEELISGGDEERETLADPADYASPYLNLTPEDVAVTVRVLENSPNLIIGGDAQSSGYVREIQPSLPIPDLEPIRAENFLEWAPTYAGRKFNLIHCDFPYGVNLFSSNGIRSGPNRSQMGQDEGESYDDEASTYQELVECLAGNLDRLMSISGHIMFWYSNKVEIDRWTRETFAKLAPSVSWTRFPLIWLKSDNAGIAASPNYEPRHIYETCLLGSRGKRQIVKIVSDAYSAPSDKSIHSSAKPEPMLRHFMTMLVDAETSLLDPTCGSGTALRAAESLGARSVLGLERNPTMVEMALRALKVERAKRRLAREF